MLRSPSSRVAALALAAGAVWVPFAWRSLSPDEGGLLLLAAQWSTGSSLYGDYFVDRPPLLIALFALADAAGGGWALRALGVLCVVATVLLAGLVGRLAATGSALGPVLPAVTAAVLTATPLFGATVVNGELLGLPFLLGGTAAALAATRSGPGRQLVWGAVAGILGAGGALVKQSLVDVFVLLAVLLLIQRRIRPVLGAAVGALATVAATTWLASLRGTDPGDLWEAVIVFRQQAAAVIAASATSSTTLRLGDLALALLASVAPFVAVALARRLRRPAAGGVPDLRWPAIAVLAWELTAVLLGGSYWLHYLMGLIPGMVLLAAAAAQRPAPLGRLLRTSYALAALSTLVALVWVLVSPIARPEAPAIDWLDAHAQPGDTAVVAFGGPNILHETGLHSPYPDLWSLPVRVHDPDLADLGALLARPDRPTWLVVAGASLGTWGIDATEADRLLAEHYEPATTAGEWTIYRRDPG